jgi:hypothetical protein
LSWMQSGVLVITATFRTLYVFVVMEMASRRILHYNVTAHPEVLQLLIFRRRWPSEDGCQDLRRPARTPC